MVRAWIVVSVVGLQPAASPIGAPPKGVEGAEGPGPGVLPREKIINWTDLADRRPTDIRRIVFRSNVPLRDARDLKM